MIFDGIIGVPLHRKRLRQRGYNQVEIIGKNSVKFLVSLTLKIILNASKTPFLCRRSKPIENPFWWMPFGAQLALNCRMVITYYSTTFTPRVVP